MSHPSPLDAIRRRLAADRENLRRAVDRIPADRRRERPGPDRWSVAEVLEHLGIVESRVAALMAKWVESAPEQPGAAATPLDRTMLRNRTVRVQAPDAIQPTGTVDADTAWAALERARSDLLAAIDRAEGRDLAAVARDHMVLGRLDGFQWLEAVGGHEERHTLQILEIADALSARATTGAVS